MRLGFLFVDKHGNILGREDLTRLNRLKWYQKFYAKINSRYRRKFVDIKPFETIKQINHEN